MPLISVITVVYNGLDTIEGSILSVLEQSYKDFEYIIIDGGSTDGTLDIIKKYSEGINYWVSEPDEGIYDAMNKGVTLSQGDYIIFLGCDDVLFDVLHEVAPLLLNKTTSYYGDVVLSKSNEVYGGKFYPLKLFSKNIPHQAIFYSRNVFDGNGFDLKYVAVADYAFNLKAFSRQEHGFSYIPKIIAKYNNESGISSTVVDQAFSLDKPRIIRENYKLTYYVIYMILRFVFKKN